MVGIQQMYDDVRGLVKDIDSSVLIAGSDGVGDGVTFGRNVDVTQVIEVEFHGPVDEKYRVRFLDLGNGTGWEFVEEDDVFTGDNSRGGLISFSRDVSAEKISVFSEFDQSEEL